MGMMDAVVPPTAPSSSEAVVDVPIEHLDYGYIEKCTNAKELQDILAFLQSGKEGRWFELEKFCEDQMVKHLDPKARKLYIAQTKGPSVREVEAANDEVSNFLKEIKSIDSSLTPNENPVKERSESIFSENKGEEAVADKPELPPVRNSSAKSKGDQQKENCSIQSQPKEKDKKDKKRISGYDWDAWDKFDVEEELKEIEEEEKKKQMQIEERRLKLQRDEKARMDKLKQNGEVANLSEPERLFLANNERQKGNECFKAAEFERSFTYYTTAIKYSANQDAAPFANRAAAALKLKRYEQAENDCTRALEIDPNYTKVYARRGMARHNRGKYLDAISDFEEALFHKPNNKELNKLLGESRKKYNEVGGIGADRSGAPPRKSNTISENFTRLTVIEDDSDDESESESECDDQNADKEMQSDVSNGTSNITEPSSQITEQTVVENQNIEESETLEQDNQSDNISIDANFVDWQDAKKAGAQHFMASEYKQALSCFTCALELLEKDDDIENTIKCLGNRAVCFKELKNFELLLKECDKIIELDPENIKAHLRRSFALEEIEDYDEALTSMCTVLRIDPNLSVASESIQRLMEKINCKTASTQVEKQPEKGPSVDTTALKEEANRLFCQGEYESAIKLYDEYLDQDPSSFTVLSNRAAAKLKIKKFTACVEDCTKGIDLIENASENAKETKILMKLYFRRAMALKERNCLHNAVGDLEKVLEVEPKNATAKEEHKHITKLLALEAEKKAECDRKKEIDREKERVKAIETAKLEQQKRISETVKKQLNTSMDIDNIPVPKTMFEFERVWKTLKGDNLNRAKYILMIPIDKIPKIFKVEIPENILVEIVESFLGIELLTERDRIKLLLQAIAKTKRFETTVRFLSKEQKKAVTQLLKHIEADAELHALYFA